MKKKNQTGSGNDKSKSRCTVSSQPYITHASVSNLKGTNCGAVINLGYNICNYCKQPILVSTYNLSSQVQTPVVNTVPLSLRPISSQSVGESTTQNNASNLQARMDF